MISLFHYADKIYNMTALTASVEAIILWKCLFAQFTECMYIPLFIPML